MNINLDQIKEIVTTCSKEVLLPRFNAVERAYKPDGSVVTEADLIMQEQLISRLNEAYPDIELLGEEMTAEQQQSLLASGDALWCLDPVDGTSNFAAGLPYFSVSLALIEKGRVTLAIVYDPIRDECFSAQRNQGAHLNGKKLSVKETGLSLKKAIVLLDFKRLSPKLATQLVTDIPYASQRSLGSIALELCWIAAGRGHLYLHAKQHLWDYAAAQLILSEAGGHACTLEGKALSSNQLAPCSTVAALDKSLFVQWCDYLNVTPE
ncbi:MAG: inositol monophosphatase family protein [Gammaproteobacteria bacterium]|nr:inositol monophosphatase family protein [Gammaproteobacteria bacterium]